jgi:AcrR family transcriptional regulator
MLAALHRLLQVQPFSDISIVDITRAAGVSRQAFYFYFPTKAAAVGELLADIYERVFQFAPWFDLRGVDSLAQLREGIEAAVSRWRSSAGLMAGMLDAV